MAFKHNAAIALVALATLVGCDRARDFAVQRLPLLDASSASHADASLFDPTATEHRMVDRVWLEAAEAALARPTVVALPYAEWGGFLASQPDARGFAFAGSEGQVVKIALARPELNETSLFVDGDVRAELFLVQARPDSVEHVRLAEIPAGQSALWFRLPASASYVVRLQAEPLTDALYRMSLELEAALPFPVKGRAEDAVRSLFGTSRDAGARHHEGIDIFAPRLTPVLAVADGRVTPRENHLGGNTVWLSTPGTSYYYAHLERVAVGSGQRVRAGEVLGYVGNTGNAATTEPHLHFGIYRWGVGAVDPFPLLQARRFPEAATGVPAAPLAQASLRRSCTPPARAFAAVQKQTLAPRGCSLAVGAALDGLSAAAAADCTTRGLANGERPVADSAHTFEWEVAAPLPIDAAAPVIVPVAFDFDSAEAAFETSRPRAADRSLVDCELESATLPRANAPRTTLLQF